MLIIKIHGKREKSSLNSVLSMYVKMFLIKNKGDIGENRLLRGLYCAYKNILF